MSACCNVDFNELKSYISETIFIELATVNSEGRPDIRTLGSFANDDFVLYFSTGRSSAKVEQIDKNPSVVVLFQQDNQELKSYKNITLYGTAIALENTEEFSTGVKLLSDRRPKFKEKAESGQLSETIIYKIIPDKLKYLNFAAGSGPSAIKEIVF